MTRYIKTDKSKYSTLYELWIVTADSSAILFSQGDNCNKLINLADEKKIRAWYIIKEKRELISEYPIPHNGT